MGNSYIKIAEPADDQITRRELLGAIGRFTGATALGTLSGNATTNPAGTDVPSIPLAPDHLPGTQPLALQGDIAKQIVAGIHKFLVKRTGASIQTRQLLWNRDYSSRANYEKSVAPNRERFKKVIGLIDQRYSPTNVSVETTLGNSPVVAVDDGYKVYRVRWNVLPGVDGEGLLLRPERTARAHVIALGDADWTPEMLAGVEPGLASQAQFARHLAVNGCQVIVPVLINRRDTWSGNPALDKFTNLTHREHIYRMTYEIGRHIIGYEVQKVLALVDWAKNTRPVPAVGIMGYGEGGLLALYSAAVDLRIDAAVVSGYFQSRQNLWEEPLYRNVWALLYEFGDAELATLVAPRTLVVEASLAPQIPGPPPATKGRLDSAASGRISSPEIDDVRAEVERARPVFEKLGASTRLSLFGDGKHDPGSNSTLTAFLEGMEIQTSLKLSAQPPQREHAEIDFSARMRRQFRQLVDYSQHAVIESEGVRKQFWSNANDSTVETWRESSESYRKYLWEEVFGRISDNFLPLAAQTRKLYEEVSWTGYEVFLPVWPEVFAYGILLLPKAIKPSERRPVVVCQHGLEGRPQDLIRPDWTGDRFYHRFAADLADHGFVVYCPQNPYIGGDKFRKLQRLANPLKLSLFSFILGQHERTLDWLSEQPFVDPNRIGFYGLSYGGKTAVRVPPLLEKYALSICSGDFNEWIWKVSRDDAPFTYVFSEEYEVPEFNLGNTFNHSDMAKLMTPRPFMVERGHNDDVSVDSWVAYEYAKVRRHYDLLGLTESTRISYFNGPHTIHGVESFEFLHRFLNWGEPFRQ